MSTLLEIKPYIHDFIEDNLDVSFANKVYWIGERKNIPEYPYCLLNAISENKDKRTSTHEGDLVYDDFREVITTLYKTVTITVGIYNAWVEDTYSDVDMDTAKEFAYEQINYLEKLFETRQIQEDFYPMFSVQNISPIRPLHEVVDGGYMYRYEFDLVLGYNEPKVDNIEVGKEVETEIYDSEQYDNLRFWFEIDSETGEINNLI